MIIDGVKIPLYSMRYQEKEIESQLGMGKCLAFDAKLLCPEERIRALCFEDKCDNYSKH
jgi:hypothetical protein